MTLPPISPEYVPVRLINSGGQADVYEVRHVGGGRYAARVLREAWDPVQREEFQRAAERQMRAAGPGVVALLAYNVAASRPFMILEYMPKGSLADEIQRRAGRFTLVEALAIGQALAEGLANFHAKGLAHSDFKPGNALQTNAGGWVLCDFGSAATISAQEIFRADGWAVTPPYTAPEQFRGVTSQASDIYALGVVVFELITAARQVTAERLLQINAVHGRLATGLPELIARMTAVDPRQRPTARAAVALLNAARRIAAPGHAPTLEPQTLVVPMMTVPGPAPAPPTPSGESSPWLKFFGTMGAVLATAAVVNRSTKRWDGGAGRYRGSDGKFRGGGMFE